TPFPGLQITAKQLLLRTIWRERVRRPAIRIALGKCLTRPLQGAVDRRSRAAEERCGFSGRPPIAQQGRGPPARRQAVDDGNKSQLYRLAGRITRLRTRRVVSDAFQI